MDQTASNERDNPRDSSNEKLSSKITKSEYYIAGQGHRARSVNEDISKALVNLPHTWRIALNEIRARYARSALGPLWLVIGTVTFILAFAVMGSVLLRIPWQAYMPYLAVGVIFWAFFSTYWIESTSMYITAGSQMMSMHTSLFDIMVRNLLRNLVIFAHSVPVLFFVCIFFNEKPILWLWVLPGFFAMLLFITPIGLFFGILATRFRDTVSAVATFLTFAIYLTPVWWLGSSVTDERARIIIDYNPLYHLLNVVREPWLGAPVPLVSWIVVLASSVLIWLVTIIAFIKYRHRITLWL